VSDRRVALATVFLLIAGCKARPTGAPIVDLQIVDRVTGRLPDPKLEVPRVETERLAKAAVAGIGGFVFRDAVEGEQRWQLTVSVELSVEGAARPDEGGVVPKDKAYRAVGVGMRLEAIETKDDLRPRYEAEALIGRNMGIFEPVVALHTEAIDAAAKYIGVEIGLTKASDAELVAKVSDDDPLIQARAIRAARERKVAAAVPPLIAILESDEQHPEVIAETIGALIELRDPSAVGPLIDSARRRPPQYQAQIIFGVAQIGGKQAEAYLFTVASGHRDPRVRQNAKDALAELERRREREGNQDE